MSAKRYSGSPAEFALLEQRFAAWRRSRAFGTRIPEPLWRAAVALAGRYGLSRTATALKLGYYALKERVEETALTREEARTPTALPTFVELPAAVAGATECVIEFEKTGGSRVRIEIKGCSLPDLVAVGRSFWDSF